MNRRDFISAEAVAAVAAESPFPPSAIAGTVQENPDLLAAQARLMSAQRAVEDAQDALNWIADEWRHLWPLAPEEILDFTGAHITRSSDPCELDILGGYLIRETASLTVRLNARQREATPETCFYIHTEADSRERLARLEASTAKGRTPASLARNAAERTYRIERAKLQMELAHEYETATRRIRQLSGVEAVLDRLAAARDEVRSIAGEIAAMPAFTLEGLRIKAAVLAPTFESIASVTGTPPRDPISQAHYLIASILEMTGGTVK